MRYRHRLKLRHALWLLAASVISGAAFGYLSADLTTGGMVRGAATGVAIAGPLILVEFFILSHIPRAALPFAAVVLVKSLVYVVAILFGLHVGYWIFTAHAVALLPRGGLLPSLAFSIALAVAVNFLTQVTLLLGQGSLSAFLFGRFHRPRLERRVFLVLDLVGSTAIAERIGGVRFFALLNDLYADLSGPVVEHRGVIHKYLGDGVIVTWRSEAGQSEGRCVEAVLEIHRLVGDLAGRYEARYGVRPRLRAGLHVGDVVTGELGDLRREIAFVGDALNVASRLIDVARDRGVDIIASAEVVAALPPSIRAIAMSIGPVVLRGRAEPVELFTLAPG